MTTAVLKPGSVEWLDARLPRTDLITIPELAVAADVASDTVQGWIDTEEIFAVDLGAGRQHFWKMSRPSILEFWAMRRLGLRRRARRRPIPVTGDLFEHAASGARQASK